MLTNGCEPGRNQLRVQTAADVRRMLATQIETVTANPDLDPIRKAHVIARLACIASRAIELDDLRERVESIETTLRSRTKQFTPAVPKSSGSGKLVRR
jgi:AmiR/NasT family two-component response regulator